MNVEHSTSNFQRSTGRRGAASCASFALSFDVGRSTLNVRRSSVLPKTPPPSGEGPGGGRTGKGLDRSASRGRGLSLTRPRAATCFARRELRQPVQVDVHAGALHLPAEVDLP